MDAQVKQELELLHNQVCLALGDPTRLMILHTLAQQPKYVNEIAEELDIPQPTASRHLRILRERSLVETTRQGPLIYYSLGDDRLVQVLDLLRGILRDRVLKQANMIDVLRRRSPEAQA